jgi:hypothetical protein
MMILRSNRRIGWFVKNQKTPFSVIPANPGSGPRQAPESRFFEHLQNVWTPVFTGVTTSYEAFKIEDEKIAEFERGC